MDVRARLLDMFKAGLGNVCGWFVLNVVSWRYDCAWLEYVIGKVYGVVVLCDIQLRLMVNVVLPDVRDAGNM